MLLYTTLCCLTLALPAADAELAGVWQLEQVIEDGRPITKTPDVQWTFTDDSLTIATAGKAPSTSKITLDPHSEPAAIDLRLDGKERLGIFEVRAGELRVAVVADRKADRGRTGYVRIGTEAGSVADAPRRPDNFGRNNFPVTVYVFRRAGEGTAAAGLPPIIVRPPPAPLPSPPKDGAPSTAPVDEAKKWPRIWRGNYFLPASK